MADAAAAPDTRSAPSANSSNKPVSKSTVILAMPEETLLIPHGPLLTIGGLMVGGAICANIAQIITSTVALFIKIMSGSSYQKMNLPGMLGSATTVGIICFGIAFVAQMGLLNIVFQINETWSKNAQGVSSGGAIKHTAIELKNQSGLVLAWAALSFVVDTVGDVTFIGIYTQDTLIMILYLCLLYAGATVMLTKGLHKIHAGMIAWEKWKAWKEALHPKQPGPRVASA